MNAEALAGPGMAVPRRTRWPKSWAPESSIQRKTSGPSKPSDSATTPTGRLRPSSEIVRVGDFSPARTGTDRMFSSTGAGHVAHGWNANG